MEEVPAEWKVYVLNKERENLKKFLTEKGFNDAMIKEVAETGRTPEQAINEKYSTTQAKNDKVRDYLKTYWGYTHRMIDEVMKTGQTPHSAEYLDDGTMVLGKRLTTTMDKKDNLRKYLLDVIGYTNKMVDEVQETGLLDPALEPYPPKLSTNEYVDKITGRNLSDAVSPDHYQQGRIQVLDFITDQRFTYLEGNIVKYICRYKTKNGLEDLEKAQYYLNELIKLVADEDERIADQLDEEILCG